MFPAPTESAEITGDSGPVMARPSTGRTPSQLSPPEGTDFEYQCTRQRGELSRPRCLGGGGRGAGCASRKSVVRWRGGPVAAPDGATQPPPRDPVHALLALGYSLLAPDLTVLGQIVGFDPYLGFSSISPVPDAPPGPWT